MARLRYYVLASLFSLGCSTPGVESIPVGDHVTDSALSAPVDVIFDEQGIPQIYGETFSDVAYVEGFLMARDRLLQMDLLRRSAGGTLSELVGGISPSVIDSDIQSRANHMQRTADESWTQLQASSDPEEQAVVDALRKFTLGVNKYISELNDGKYQLPTDVVVVYPNGSTTPWKETDSIMVGILLAYQLSYGAGDEINRSLIEAAAAAEFADGKGVDRAARKGIGADLTSLAPAFAAYTFPGDFSTLKPAPATASVGVQSLAVLRAGHAAISGRGNDHLSNREHGSNNWVIGPKLTKNGHVIVCNDPHLSLSNPPIFYLVHLVARGGTYPMDVTGAQFPGAPGVILGANRRVAWGSTVSNLDVTDVYREVIAPCSSDASKKCVTFKAQEVALAPRVESIGIGTPGLGIKSTLQVTLWDVPHHGPIIPHLGTDHLPVALGAEELSVRWTGHEPTSLLSAVFGLNKAKTVAEAAAQLEKHFKVGGQNWVLGDADGHFGWTQAVRVPRRPAGTQPWKVLPGDGSAEWLNDLSQDYVPHAFDPEAGFLATANADPIGVTDDGEPFATEPVVDGIPLYVGADFDPGSRVYRIQKRITELGNKITVEDMAKLQADHTSEWDRGLVPTITDGARSLEEELATPGVHPELSALALSVSANVRSLSSPARALVEAWDFDTSITSVPATIVAMSVSQLATLALKDELDVIQRGLDSSQQLKILMRMCNTPEKLATGRSSTGDSILWDDLGTPVIEGKRLIAAKAWAAGLDALVAKLGADTTVWTWGSVHTLALEPLVPIAALRIPRANEEGLSAGFPRPGSNGTVDVGAHGLSTTSFSYDAGPAIRSVYEADPAVMRGRTVLPGGQVFDASSPHYRDLMELWRNNQSFQLAFTEGDAVRSAERERSTNMTGRFHFANK